MRRLLLRQSAVRLVLLIAGGVALAAPAIATGGPTSPSATLASGSTLGGAAPSSPTVGSIIYNQYDNATPTPPTDVTSQDFEDSLNTADSETADDFTIPANTTWTIDGVAVDGEYRSSNFQTPAPFGFHVRFWANNPATNLPANMLAERLQQTYTS